MTDEIITKISDEINKGINSEAQVLYLLVEMRKARLARTNNSKTFLDFYRDWACHTELYYPNAVKMFLDDFEPLVDENLSSHQIASIFIEKIPSFFKLDNLKQEIRDFLDSEKLKKELALTDDLKRWNVFINHLLNILKDCSIKQSDTNKKIEELILQIGKDGNFQFKFRLRGRKDSAVCKLKWK